VQEALQAEKAAARKNPQVGDAWIEPGEVLYVNRVPERPDQTAVQTDNRLYNVALPLEQVCRALPLPYVRLPAGGGVIVYVVPSAVVEVRKGGIVVLRNGIQLMVNMAPSAIKRALSMR
jgi:hypothetical protein